MKRGLIIALIIAALMVIGSYLYMQYRKLIDADWTLAGKRLKKFGLDRVIVEVLYDIDNKGDLEITVSEQSYDVFLNGRFISKVQNTDDVRIKARSISRMPLTVEVKTADFMRVLGSNWQALLLGDKSKIIFTLAGHFTMKMGALAFRQYPFNMTFTLAEAMNESSGFMGINEDSKTAVPIGAACTCPGVNDSRIIGGWCWCHDPINSWHPLHVSNNRAPQQIVGTASLQQRQK